MPVLLRGLRDWNSRHRGNESELVDVTAIVCVSDDGGSSGILRQAFGIPALGDLRNCIVGLSDEKALFADLLQYRFSRGEGLAGHALGNLILTALYQRSGSLRDVVQSMSELVRLEGRVLPATEENVTLCARFNDGGTVRGESEICARRRSIDRVWLAPRHPAATEEAVEAIETADVVVLGPGSLYTSIVPNLLVPGVAEAVGRSQAVKICACNLMTQPGETEGLSAADHLRVLQRYLGGRAVDYCILNRRLDFGLARTYREVGAALVEPDEEAVAALGVVPVCADLLVESGQAIRHDPRELARWIVALAPTKRNLFAACDVNSMNAISRSADPGNSAKSVGVD